MLKKTKGYWMESEKEFEGERKKTFREVFGTNARRAGAN